MCGPIRVSQLNGVLVGSGGEWKSPLSEPRITIKDDVIGMQADNTQADILADQPTWLVFNQAEFLRRLDFVVSKFEIECTELLADWFQEYRLVKVLGFS